MGRVTHTRRAAADLDEIWLHVASESLTAADRLIDRIAARCQDLAEHSELGPARPEIAPDARMLVIDDYLVLYHIKGSNVQVVRVVHGARRLQGLFDTNE